MTDHGHEVRESGLAVEFDVDLGNNRLGREYVGPGASFSLGNIFGEGEIGGSRFSEVYIHTTNNEYRLEEDSEDLAGLLTDASASRAAGGKLKSTLLDRKTLAERRIVIGQPFDYSVGTTSDVTGIVAVSRNRVYDQKALDFKTQGRKSTVVSDFKTACLPKGAEQN